MAARVVATLAAAWIAVSSGGCGGGEEAREAVGINGCRMVVALFERSAERLRPFVPDGYRLGGLSGAGKAHVAVWALSCRRVQERFPGRPLVLALTGVEVQPRNMLAPERAPSTLEHYLLAGQTNDARFAARARAAGLPVKLVPGMRLDVGPATTVTVPGRRDGFHLAIEARTLDTPHDHANVFWHGAPDRPASLGLRLHDVNDHACGSEDLDCSTVLVPARGSRLARLVGAGGVVAQSGFDHLPIRRGTLIVTGP